MQTPVRERIWWQNDDKTPNYTLDSWVSECVCMKSKFKNKQTKEQISLLRTLLCRACGPESLRFGGWLTTVRTFLRGNVPLSLRPEPLLECSDISEISIYVLPEQRADMSEWPTSSVELDGQLMPVYQRCHKLRLQTLEALHKTLSRYGMDPPGKILTGRTWNGYCRTCHVWFSSRLIRVVTQIANIENRQHQSGCGRLNHRNKDKFWEELRVNHLFPFPLNKLTKNKTWIIVPLLIHQDSFPNPCYAPLCRMRCLHFKSH